MRCCGGRYVAFRFSKPALSALAMIQFTAAEQVERVQGVLLGGSVTSAAVTGGRTLSLNSSHQRPRQDVRHSSQAFERPGRRSATTAP